MGYSVDFTPMPPGEYRDRAAPHVRQAWGGKRSNELLIPLPGHGTRQYYPCDGDWGLMASRWLSAGVGQVNERGERNSERVGFRSNKLFDCVVK